MHKLDYIEYVKLIFLNIGLIAKRRFIFALLIVIAYAQATIDMIDIHMLVQNSWYIVIYNALQIIFMASLMSIGLWAIEGAFKNVDELKSNIENSENIYTKIEEKKFNIGNVFGRILGGSIAISFIYGILTFAIIFLSTTFNLDKNIILLLVYTFILGMSLTYPYLMSKAIKESSFFNAVGTIFMEVITLKFLKGVFNKEYGIFIFKYILAYLIIFMVFFMIFLIVGISLSVIFDKLIVLNYMMIFAKTMFAILIYSGGIALISGLNLKENGERNE